MSLSKTLYSPKILVIPRKRWHRPDMTEKLLTGTLNFSTNKQTNKNFLSTCRSIRTVLLLEDRESRTNNHFFLCHPEIHTPEYFNFQAELTHATLNNTLADYLTEEMRKIREADLIILQCPMYWIGLPAIMKGWFDKCFADKVAYDLTNFKWFDDGPFKVMKPAYESGCIINMW